MAIRTRQLDMTPHAHIRPQKVISIILFSTVSHKLPTEPLGVSYPGHTWTEGHDKPNWVGHLVKPHTKDTNHDNPKFLVYDYAMGGATITGVHEQIHRDFLPTVGERPKWASWKETDTLFGEILHSH